MSTSQVGAESQSNPLRTLTPLHLIGILLASVTGVIHLYLGVGTRSVALFIAGVGFTIGVATIVAGFRRQTMIKLGIPFTATQTAYYLATHFDQLTALSITDKIVQIALIAVLVVLARRS